MIASLTMMLVVVVLLFVVGPMVLFCFEKSRQWILAESHLYFVHSRRFLSRLAHNYRKEGGYLITEKEFFQELYATGKFPFRDSLSHGMTVADLGRDVYIDLKDGIVMFYLRRNQGGLQKIPKANLKIIWVGNVVPRAVLRKQGSFDWLFKFLAKVKPELPTEWGQLLLPEEWQHDPQKMSALL